MFILALFTMAKIWKQPRCPPTGEWIKNCGIHIHTMEYYSAIKNNEILPFAITWMDFKGIMLSELSSTGKDKYHIFSLICGISVFMWSLYIYGENRFAVADMWGCGWKKKMSEFFFLV